MAANKPVVRVLDNGLRVITFTNVFHTSMIGVFAGHLHDSPELRGVAHTTEHIMIRGASAAYLQLMKSRTPKPVGEKQLLRIMRRYLGGTDGEGMNVFTVPTYTSYGHADLMSRLDLKKVFHGFASTIRDGTYDLRESGHNGILGDPALPVERNATFNEAGHGREDLVRKTTLRGESILYKNHVLSRSWGDPDEKQIDRFTLDALKRWARQHYVPSNMCVVFSGPKIHQAMEMIKKAELDQLPHWPLTGLQPEVIVPKLNDPVESIIPWPSTDMTHVTFMWPTETDSSEDRFALMVLAPVLKELIEEELRETLFPYPGGVYHPSVEWDASPVHGCIIAWYATIGGQAHARELGGRVLKVIRSIQKKRVTTELEEIVDDFKYNLVSGHKNVLEYDGGTLVESAMDSVASGDVELEEFNRYPENIQGVTAQDVSRVARKYLKEDGFVQVMLGPNL